VQILTGNVTYTGDVNVWTWGADSNLFTICASNLPEIAGGTHKVATGTEVVVTLFADATSTDKSAYWAFSLAAGITVKWFKAYEAWTYVVGANASYVNCHPCDGQDGTGEDTDTDVQVWLPRGSLEQDPNVEVDAVISATADSNGEYIATDAALDERVYRSIKMWHGTTAPAGWALCDGSLFGDSSEYFLPDLRARFIVGYYGAEGHGATADITGTSGEYNEIADKGGSAWHGAGEYEWDAGGTDANNHQDHESHIHKTPSTAITYAEGVVTGGSVSAPHADTGVPYVDASDPMVLRHGGFANETPGPKDPVAEFAHYADTDNRPAYYTLAFIMRTDNSKNTDVPVPAELTA